MGIYIKLRDALIDKTMEENGITYEEATKHVCGALMPRYTKELTIEEEGYDEYDIIDAAENQRKFLLQRMLPYAVVLDNLVFQLVFSIYGNHQPRRNILLKVTICKCIECWLTHAHRIPL